jgi:ribosomal protection tetracycline resistance protein
VRVEPGPVDSGFTYRLAVDRGWLLPSFHTAIEETLAKELQNGLQGWRIVDCVLTLIQSRFGAPTPPAGCFRALTSASFRLALKEAGTVVCEPVSALEVEGPAGVMTGVLRELGLPHLTGGRGVLLPRPPGYRPVGGEHRTDQVTSERYTFS